MVERRSTGGTTLRSSPRASRPLKKEDADAPYTPARYQGFRRAVVSAYDHRCAFCGIRMFTSDGHTVVEAAHIIPWAVAHNDDPRNGLALCRLCHWAFDEGLLGVSAAYTLLAAAQLSLAPNLPGHLAPLQGRAIFLPVEEPLHPDLAALAWHRRKRMG
ncbi:MAG: HNH endonuclease [Caldilinea sp.]|nr:HNH endonuclease [Caldilinea sp.]MCB0048538.1 HNH endonuclease [Caldilinea sp.]